MKTKPVCKKAWFKRHQEDGIYHYYEVYGGEGKTEQGFQVVINFLNDTPMIMVEHNDTSCLTGTWCTYEVGIAISEEEYSKAYQKALEHPDLIIL
ncbi:MAG: hypothetical protein R2828_35560 [Saprospiraceae bacterium]